MPHPRSLLSLCFGGSCLAVLALSSPVGAQSTWADITPQQIAPGRAGHAMAYDRIRDRIVMFGGLISGLGFQNDTWEYDGVAWVQMSPATSPPARAGHPMAYDPLRGKTVLYGGIPIGGGALGDTWEWDGVNWTQVFTTTQPGPRRSHPMVWHPLRGTVVACGGFGGGVDLNDLWEYDGVDWRPITTANAPSGRRASEMAYDPNTAGLVLFSGYQQGADTWLFDGLDWRQIVPATIPTPRYDHTMTTDPVRNRIVMFGGTPASETWEWDGIDWLRRTPALSPPGRYDAWLVWDDLRSRSVMFGGIQGTDDLWSYATPQVASWNRFGAACRGSNGNTPLLDSSDRPWLGETFDVVLGGLPAAGPVFILIGLSATNWGAIALPFDLGAIGMTGCWLHVDPLVQVGLAAAGGQASFSLPIPVDVALGGASVYYQGLAADAAANAFGAISTNAGDVRIGIK
ncbi:MAG: hypothetical protein HZB39_16725 [Planctomycetes bacterium]|nr:hypothetical protein [Planctomycetota bacterium]